MDLNPIVKYDNWMNDLSFKNFTAMDYNMFFILCSLLRDKNTDTISISFDEIRALTNYKRTSNKELAKDLREMNVKLLAMSCMLDLQGDGRTTVQFNFFNFFKVSEPTKMLTVNVSSLFTFVINNLLNKYTMFDFRTFMMLKSKYSKTLFRLFKQWNGRLRFECSVEKLRELLDIPEKYDVKRINANIIKPAIEEIQKTGTFLHLTYKVKKSRKQGHPTTSYIFTWATRDGVKIKNIENYTEKELDKLMDEYNSLPSELRGIAEIIPDDQCPGYAQSTPPIDVDVTPFLQDEDEDIIPPKKETDFMDMSKVMLTEADKQMILDFLRNPSGGPIYKM